MLLLTKGRLNPVAWYSQCAEAYILAFSSASSAGTLPVTIRVVQKGNQVHVPEALAKFICSLGSTVHKDGAAVVSY
jgi:Na+/H+-dicarboxylate symporter